VQVREGLIVDRQIERVIIQLAEEPKAWSRSKPKAWMMAAEVEEIQAQRERK
jgi:hypothetical protein